MIVVDKVLISDEIAEAQFVCDLNKCKGGCCEEGDAGDTRVDSLLGSWLHGARLGRDG